MFCPNCGNQYDDNAAFCPACGAQTAQNVPPVDQPQQYAQPQYAQPDYAQPNYAQPVQAQPMQQEIQLDPQGAALAKSILVFGILALCFACSYYVSFMGIVFGAMCNSRVNQFVAMYGQVFKQAKVGRILGKVGFILGIVLTVCSLITYIACLAGGCSSYYYY